MLKFNIFIMVWEIYLLCKLILGTLKNLTTVVFPLKFLANGVA